MINLFTIYNVTKGHVLKTSLMLFNVVYMYCLKGHTHI